MKKGTKSTNVSVVVLCLMMDMYYMLKKKEPSPRLPSLGISFLLRGGFWSNLLFSRRFLVLSVFRQIQKREARLEKSKIKKQPRCGRKSWNERARVHDRNVLLPSPTARMGGPLGYYNGFNLEHPMARTIVGKKNMVVSFVGGDDPAVAEAFQY